MRRGPNTTNLTKDYIESKISQELIISKYLNIDINVVKNCIEKNVLIESVFRTDDTNKSMGIQYNNKGKLKVRDFGGFGFFDDVYGVVAYVLSHAYGRQIDTKNKSDFYFVLKHIASTFADIIDNKEVDPNLEYAIADGLNTMRHTKRKIDIAFRPWNKNDSNLWNKWKISLTFLDTHYVYAVDQFYIDRTPYSVPKYYYNENDPCYAYYLGTDNKGIINWKLYFPLRDRSKQLKFITNANCIEGWYNLENIKYDYIIITKSSKDRLAIGNHLLRYPLYGRDGKINIGIVNVSSENYKLHDEEYKILFNRTKSGKIFSLFDFDTTGRKGAKYLSDTYGIKYLFITRGEFGLPNYGCKDFAELVEKYNEVKVVKFVKETLSYIINEYESYSAYNIEDEIPY